MQPRAWPHNAEPGEGEVTLPSTTPDLVQSLVEKDEEGEVIEHNNDTIFNLPEFNAEGIQHLELPWSFGQPLPAMKLSMRDLTRPYRIGFAYDEMLPMLLGSYKDDFTPLSSVAALVFQPSDVATQEDGATLESMRQYVHSMKGCSIVFGMPEIAVPATLFDLSVTDLLSPSGRLTTAQWTSEECALAATQLNQLFTLVMERTQGFCGLLERAGY